MPDTVPSAAAIDLIATRFRALAEPVRLRLLLALGRTERSVSELVDASGTGQANVSKHLGVLLESGIVGRRREGSTVLYRVVDASVFELCDTVCASLRERLSVQQTAVAAFADRKGAE
jgi:ArsR family transcriptional regulator